MLPVTSSGLTFGLCYLCCCAAFHSLHACTGSSEGDGDESDDEAPSDENPGRRTTAAGRASALEEMKRRRAKGRASDDHRRALELALSGGADPAAGTSSGGSRGKSLEKDSSRGERSGTQPLGPSPVIPSCSGPTTCTWKIRIFFSSISTQWLIYRGHWRCRSG